jgi:hypothetical protein
LACAAVRRGPRPAMGREDLPLAGTEQATGDPDTRPLPDRSRTGMPSGPPAPAWGAGPRRAAGHLPVRDQGHSAQLSPSSAPVEPASAHTAGRGLARRPAQNVARNGWAGSWAVVAAWGYGRGMRISGVLIDIDGVLTVSWRPLPGAVAALRQLRAAGLRLALVTNTTSRPRASIAATSSP